MPGILSTACALWHGTWEILCLSDSNVLGKPALQNMEKYTFLKDLQAADFHNIVLNTQYIVWNIIFFLSLFMPSFYFI